MRHAFAIWIVIFCLYALFGHSYEEIEYSASVVPGWHTTVFPISIYSPWDTLQLIPEVFFLVTIIGYGVLRKYDVTVKPAFFFVHLFLNLPALLRWWYPSVELRNTYPENLNTMVWINKAGLGMMVLALAIFAVYFIYTVLRLREQKLPEIQDDLQTFEEPTQNEL